jgi:Protein of unknown function (DUF3383)
MADINSIVNFSVSVTGAPPKQGDFGTPMIVDYHAAWPERVRYYSDAAAVVTDGLGVNTGVYKAVSAALAQNPRPVRVAVGRRALAPDRQIDIAPVAASLTQYKVRVVGPTGLSGTALFTSGAAATVAQIVTGLTSAINALAITGVVATDQTTNVRIKASTVGAWFVVEADGAKQTHADPGLTADLVAIAAENKDWFTFFVVSASAAEVVAAATWGDTNKRPLVQSVQDADALGALATDVIGINKANSTKATVNYHQAPDQFMGVAIAASVLANPPGSVIAAFRRLVGVTASLLSDTAIANLRAKNGNFYTDYGGLSLFLDGKVGNGQYFDVIRDQAWFEALLTSNVFAVLAGGNKVPFTDAGIARVENAVRASVRAGIDAGFLVSGSDSYQVPRAASISAADKQNRKLRTIKFFAQIAGAIQSVDGTGVLGFTGEILF